MKLPNEIIRACATLSQAAYADAGDDDQEWSEHVRNRLAARGFDDVRTWVNSDSELLAAGFDGYRIYAWRGSESVADWIKDFNARLINFYDLGKVHAGFAYNYRSIWQIDNSLVEDLAEYRAKSHKIICTGHSLGGATAVAMAAFELQRRHGIQGLVTFGAPRVGNATFAAFVTAGVQMSGGHIYRFVNLCDPVPAVPTLWRYRHAGAPHYFSLDGSLKVRPSFAWMQLDRALTTFARWKIGKLGPTMNDHAIDEYRAKIKRKFRLLTTEETRS